MYRVMGLSLLVAVLVLARAAYALGTLVAAAPETAAQPKPQPPAGSRPAQPGAETQAPADARGPSDARAAEAEAAANRFRTLAPQVELQDAALPSASETSDVKLLFLSGTTGSGSTLATIKLDGTGLTPLPVTGRIVHFAVSPSMDRMLYVIAESRGDERPVFKLFVSDLAGKTPVLVSDKVGDPNFDRFGGTGSDAFSYCGDPTYTQWSPDGKRILYSGWRAEDGTAPFYIVDATDRKETLLLRVPGPTKLTIPLPGAQPPPQTQPKEEISKNLLLTKWIDDKPPRGGRGMGVQLDPQGGARVGGLPSGAAAQADVYYCSDVRWHPDGKSITWSSDLDPKAPAIWVRPLEGLKSDDPASVTAGATKLPWGQHFLWAPDGKQLAVARWFADKSGDAVQVFLVDRETGNITRELLRESAAGVLGPKVRLLAWSPDSKRLAIYVSEAQKANTIPTGSIRVYDVAAGGPATPGTPATAGQAPAPVEVVSGRIPPLSRQVTQYRRATFTPDGKSLVFVHLTLASTPGLPITAAAIQTLDLGALAEAPPAPSAGARPQPANTQPSGRPPTAATPPPSDQRSASGSQTGPPKPEQVHRVEGTISAIAILSAPQDIDVPPLPLVIPAAALEGTLKDWLLEKKGEVERHLRVASDLTDQIKPLAAPSTFDPFPLLAAWHGQHAGILKAERDARDAAEWFFRALAGAWDRMTPTERSQVEKGLEARAWALRRYRTAKRVLLRESVSRSAPANSETFDAYYKNLWKSTWAAAEIEALARMWAGVNNARLALDGRYDVYEIDDKDRDAKRATDAEASQGRHLQAAIDLGIAGLLASESQYEAAMDARKSRLFAVKEWVEQVKDAARDPSVGRAAAREVVQILGLGFNLFDLVAGFGADWNKRAIDRVLGVAVDADTRKFLFGDAFHTRAEKIDDELVKNWEKTQFKLLLLRFLKAKPLAEVRTLAREALTGKVLLAPVSPEKSQAPDALVEVFSKIAPGKIEAADVRSLLEDRAFYDTTRGGLLRFLAISLTGFQERCQMELLIARDKARLIRRDMQAAYRIEQGQDPQTGELTWATIISPMAWTDLVTKTLSHMDDYVARSLEIRRKGQQLEAMERLSKALPAIDFAFDQLKEKDAAARDHVSLLGVSAPYLQFAVRVREEETNRDLHQYWRSLRGLTGNIDATLAIAVALRDALPRASAEAERETESARMIDLEYLDLIYSWDLAGALSLAEWMSQEPPGQAPGPAASPDAARAPPATKGQPVGKDPAADARARAEERRQLFAQRAKALRDAINTQHLKDQGIPIFRNVGDMGLMLAAFRFLGPGPVTAAEAQFLGIQLEESFARYVFNAFNPLAMGPRAVIAQSVTEVAVGLGVPYTGEKYEALLNQVVGLLVDIPLDRLAQAVAKVRAGVRAQLEIEQARFGQLDAQRYVADVFSRSLLRASEGYLALRARWAGSNKRAIRGSVERTAGEATHMTRRWLEVEWLDEQARRLRETLKAAVDDVTIAAYIDQRRTLRARVAPPSVAALDRLVRERQADLFDAARGLDIETLRADLADLWRRTPREQRAQLEALERLIDEERDLRFRRAMGDLIGAVSGQIQGVILNGTRPGHAEYKGVFSDRDFTIVIKPGTDPAAVRRVANTIFKRYKVVLNGRRAPPSADIELMVQDFVPGQVKAISSFQDFERWTKEFPKDPHRFLSAGGNVWVGVYNHLNGGTMRPGGAEAIVEPSPDPNLLARPPTDAMLAHGLLLDVARFDVSLEPSTIRSTETLAELTGKRAKQVLRAVDALIWANAPELIARRTPEASRDRGYHRLIVDDARELVRRGLLSPEEFRTVVYLYTMKKGASVAQAFGIDAASLEGNRGRIENLWGRMDGLMRRAFQETRRAHLDGLARRVPGINGDVPAIEILRAVALENRISAAKIPPEQLALLSGLSGEDVLEQLWRQDKAAIELGNRRLQVRDPPTRVEIRTAAGFQGDVDPAAITLTGAEAAPGDVTVPPRTTDGGPTSSAEAPVSSALNDTADRVRFGDDRRPDEGVEPHAAAAEESAPAPSPPATAPSTAEAHRQPVDTTGAEVGEWNVKVGDRVVGDIKNPQYQGRRGLQHDVVASKLAELLGVPIAFSSWLDGDRVVTRHVDGVLLYAILEGFDPLTDRPVRAPPGWTREGARQAYLKYRILSAMMGHFGTIFSQLIVTPDGRLVATGVSGAEPFPPGDSALSPEAVRERMRRGIRGENWPSAGKNLDVFRQFDQALNVSREEALGVLDALREKITLPDGKLNEAVLEAIAKEYGPDAKQHAEYWRISLLELDALLAEILPRRDEIGRFEVKAMGTDYIGEEKPEGSSNGKHAKYLTPEERAKCCKLTIKDGLVYDSEGNLYDSRGYVTDGHVGEVIYIMDGNGDFYAIEGRAGTYHHSSLADGKPVASAGHLVVEDGVIKKIDNNSGHYHPARRHLNQAAERLGELGVDTNGIVQPIE